MYRLIRYAQPLAANVATYRSRWNGLEQEFNTLFGSLGSDVVRSIPVSVNEDKDNLQISAELPGVQRADVNVEIVDEVLSLKATRKIPGLEGEQIVSYAREFDLPYPVQADKVTAELKEGVLRLTLPKVEAVKPRKIDIS